MTCPDCERYKKSAAMWRNKAYEAAGHPLPWKPDELWQGLTLQEIEKCIYDANNDPIVACRNVEAKLKEKNT
jgi:hypothetical protein